MSGVVVSESGGEMSGAVWGILMVVPALCCLVSCAVAVSYLPEMFLCFSFLMSSIVALSKKKKPDPYLSTYLHCQSTFVVRFS